MASHLTDSYRCPSSSNYEQPTVEPAKRVLQRPEASTALHQISALASAVTNEPATDLPALRRLHIDYAHSISIGVHREKYFLLHSTGLTLPSALLQLIVRNQKA